MMFELNYVKPEEIATIPRLAKAPVAIVYARSDRRLLCRTWCCFRAGPPSQCF